MPEKNKSEQLRSFIEIARALGCDENKEAFEAKLGKIAVHKPKDDGTPPKSSKKSNIRRKTGDD